jgi:hypothetical protein
MAQKKEKCVHFGIRIPQTLDDAIARYISFDTHATKSEFAREALREALNARAPKLLENMVKEARLEQEKDFKLKKKIEEKFEHKEVLAQEECVQTKEQ